MRHNNHFHTTISLLLLSAAALTVTGCKTGPADAPPESVVQGPPATEAPPVEEDAGNEDSDPENDDDPSEAENYPAAALFQHADFEFCCSQYGTYEAHGFAASGVVKMLDGGHWAESIDGAEGERVFASYGDGYDDASDTSAEWKGWELTGTLTTPEFTIPARYINFLVGGGTNAFDSERPTAVVLRVGGEVVRHATGNGREASLSVVTWDVSEYQDQAARIEIIDGHDDVDDSSYPFILVDRIQASSSAETTPSGQAGSGSVEVVYTETPETEGASLFSRPGSEQNIAGFEFCCGGFDAYQAHSFGVTGDLVYLDGGEWAANFEGKQGERVFASFGNAFEDGGDNFFLGWDAVGRVSSPEFVIGSRYINFLLGGGSNAYNAANATAVVLRVNGEVVRHASGDDVMDSLVWHTWDVSAFKGHKAVIELMDLHPDDGSDEALAFVLADEFRSADKAAETPEEASVVTNVVPGPLASRLKMGDPNPYYEGGTYHVFYLHDNGHHPWYLSSTDNLMDFSDPVEVLSPGEASDAQDNWTGSGSVVKDAAGDYHLFYTGHNQTIEPVEAVMVAGATDGALTHWEKQPEKTFTGTDGYSDFDFRDPWVFWNEPTQNYWMLLTSRYNGEAAIARYTSDDLQDWTAEAPLYQESSELNLEVPDLLRYPDSEFLVYSDQRNDARQVRHLVPDGAGGWTYPAHEALDGRGFYAGRSAGPEADKLLFGWVPHKLGRVDSGVFRWGGDLVTHEVYVNASDDLAVKLPDALVAALASEKATEPNWQSGSVTVDGDTLTLQGDSAFTLAPATELTRLSLTLNSVPASGDFGVYFRDSEGAKQAFVALNAETGQARFALDATAGNPNDPVVSLPLEAGESVAFDILLDPVKEYGVVYVNDFRALTFRFYELEDYDIGLYSRSGLAVTALSRFE